MSLPDRETECLIGLGGNVGSVVQTMQMAFDQLTERGCEILDASRFYRSAPMGPEAGPEFVNAAVRVRTSFSPHDLLELLQQIEQESGRTRGVHWGPRTLDLDLLCYGQQQLWSDDLVIPHPGIWYRRFVLEPLSEIAPDWQHAGIGISMSALRRRLEVRPLRIEVVAHELAKTPERHRGAILLEHLVPEQAARQVDPGVFCRFLVDASPQPECSTEPGFLLIVRPDDLDSMVSSVADAALGKCEP